MTEQPGETPPIQSGLNVIHKRGGIIENTIGRILSIPSNLILWTPTSIWKNIPKEKVEEIKQRYKDVPWQGNYEVYLNHAPFFKRLKRLFSGQRRSNIFARILLGIPSLIEGTIAGKFARTDHYDPFSESVVVYNQGSGVVEHEIGHAIDFDRAPEPTVRTVISSLTEPFSSLYLEPRASCNAMRYMKPEERLKAQKVLEPGFGTYLGGIASLALAPLTGGLSIIPYAATILAGHIHSRISKKNIFFNDEPVNQRALATLQQPIPTTPTPATT